MSLERREKLKKGKSGVVFAIFQNGEILLEERLDPKKEYYGYTIIPGGGIERGESVWHTLEREIEEECGCLHKASVYLSSHTQRDGNSTHERHLFLVTHVTGEINNIETEKCRHLWATLVEARYICKHPDTQEFLDVIEDYFNEEGLKVD